jgi:hypothetical protein
VKEDGDAAGDVAYALGNIAESDAGRQSCIDAGAPLALTNLAKEKAVKENGYAAKWVAVALSKLAESDTGRQSCIAAGAPLVLTNLAKEKAVKENGDAAMNVAGALYYITMCASGRQSCIAAGAPIALTDLAKEKAVKENGDAARCISQVYKTITEKVLNSPPPPPPKKKVVPEPEPTTPIHVVYKIPANTPIGIKGVATSTPEIREGTGCTTFIQELKEGGLLKTSGAIEGSGIFSIAGVDVSTKTRADILDVAKNAAMTGQGFDFILSYKRGTVPTGANIQNQN